MSTAGFIPPGNIDPADNAGVDIVTPVIALPAGGEIQIAGIDADVIVRSSS